MRTLIVGVFVSAALAAGLILVAGGGNQASAGVPSVDYAGVDLDPTGNTCNSLGATEQLLENVALNTPFTIDVVVKGVPVGPDGVTPDGGGLFGTGFELIYNDDIIRVTGATTGTGNVLHQCDGTPVPLDVFDLLPDTDGEFRVDTIDLSGVEESGDGRLVSITLECIAQGGAALNFGDFSTGGGDVPGILGDSGEITYTVATEGTGQVGCGIECPGGTCPTPTPPPGEERLWPDVNCDESIDPIDGLGILRFDAGLSVNQQPGCPAVGEPVTVDGTERQWGDANCDNSVDPIDGLGILRYDAGLSVNQQPGCPGMGNTVTVQS